MIFNVIPHVRDTAEGVYSVLKWQSFVPDTIYALGLLADEREAISIWERLGVQRLFLHIDFGGY